MGIVPWGAAGERTGSSLRWGGSDLWRATGVIGAGPVGAGRDWGGLERSEGTGYSHLNFRPAHRLQAARRVDVWAVMQANPCLTQWVQGNYERESVNWKRNQERSNLPHSEPGARRRQLEEGAR